MKGRRLTIRSRDGKPRKAGKQQPSLKRRKVDDEEPQQGKRKVDNEEPKRNTEEGRQAAASVDVKEG